VRAILLGLLCFSTPAFAQQPVSVPDATLKLSAEDQKNFREVCAVAMKSPATSTDTTYQISAWCMTMLNKIAEAGKLKEEPPK
jgi:hypothetical protein